MSRLIADPATWPGAILRAWVLMPDHWHGLVTLDGTRALSTLVKHAKGTTARRFNRSQGRAGNVWRDGFHDRAIRQDQDLRTVARYIIANPLRAGLAEQVGDYPYWDAEWLQASGEEIL
jgi:REP element-mobilizing transposase RayT